MIKTSQGLKTPAEALALFVKAKLAGGDLLGIWNQLIGYPEGAEAAKVVLANPGNYSEKLQRLAKEKATGRPIGAKVIHSETDLRQFLRACGLRSEVRITFKEDQARRVLTVANHYTLEIDDYSREGLVCVAISGEWQLVPRILTTTLTLPTDRDVIETTSALFGIVEKVELICTLAERAKVARASEPLSAGVKATLAANPDLFYDRSTFIAVCQERSFGRQIDEVDQIDANASMEDVLMKFFVNSSREEFLEYYIVRFYATLA